MLLDLRDLEKMILRVVASFTGKSVLYWRDGDLESPTLPFFVSVTHRQTLLAIHSFTCHRSIQTLCFFLSQVWELYIFPGICPLLSKLTSMLP